MKVGGENPKKIINIVEGSFPHFIKLYRPLLHNYPYLKCLDLPSSEEENKIEKCLHWQLCPTFKKHELEKELYSKLPRGLLSAINKEMDTDLKSNGIPFIQSSHEVGSKRVEIQNENDRATLSMITENHYLYNGLSNIVSASSWSQGMKGVWTAGPTKAFKYGLQKLKKGILKRTSLFF